MSAPAHAAATVALALIETATDVEHAAEQVRAAREAGARDNAIRRSLRNWRITQTYRPVRP